MNWITRLERLAEVVVAFWLLEIVFKPRTDNEVHECQ
jgi:hypothetical protein